MIKWYWIFISLPVGITIGFSFTFFNIRRLLLAAIAKPGGSLRPPGEINKEAVKEAVEKIVDRLIEKYELGVTTEEIIDEMNNLPEYKP